MQMKEIEADLEARTYPLTSEELVDRFETERVDLPNGTQHVSDIFGLFENETYADAEEARTALYCGLGSGAIGRKNYSDRDPTLLGANDHEPVSF